MPQNVCSHHVRTVVAQEHIVGNDIRTNLQFNLGIVHAGHNSSTVTTTIDTAMDNGRFVLRSYHADRHLFGIGADGIEGLNGFQLIGSSRETCFL